MKYITSPDNFLVKQLFRLKEKSREREKTRLFVIEGVREISLALRAGYSLNTLFFCPDICSEETLRKKIPYLPAAVPLTMLSETVYRKIAHRGTTEGLLALAHAKEHSLEGFSLQNKRPLVLVAEAPEKPGNIGALLRTADAAGVDAVLIANPKTDLYNPNLIRSSVGCVFTTPVAIGSVSEIIQFLQQRRIALFCASADAPHPYYEVDFTQPAAIVVGAEADGLSEVWFTQATERIGIPMQGEIDSMNVSVAAAILIFEAKRQRGFQ